MDQTEIGRCHHFLHLGVLHQEVVFGSSDQVDHRWWVGSREQRRGSSSGRCGPDFGYSQPQRFRHADRTLEGILVMTMRSCNLPLTITIVALSVGLAGSRCDSGGEAACVPGAQENCGCLGGAIGIQVCADDGESFGVCECSFPDGDSDVDGDGDIYGDGDVDSDGDRA